MSTPSNPYRSPPPSDRAKPALFHYHAPDWGKLNPIWLVSYLFGYVWLLGSIGTYILLLAMPMSIKTMLTPDHSYDAAGYVSFITCSVVAMFIGIPLLIRHRADFNKPWPNGLDAWRCLVASTLVMTPAWIVYAVLADNYRFQLPGDGNWVAISAAALLGLVHGWQCKRGLQFRRKEKPRGEVVAPINMAEVVKHYVVVVGILLISSWNALMALAIHYDGSGLLEPTFRYHFSGFLYAAVAVIGMLASTLLHWKSSAAVTFVTTWFAATAATVGFVVSHFYSLVGWDAFPTVLFNIPQPLIGIVIAILLSPRASFRSLGVAWPIAFVAVLTATAVIHASIEPAEYVEVRYVDRQLANELWIPRDGVFYLRPFSTATTMIVWLIMCLRASFYAAFQPNGTIVARRQEQ